MHCLLIHPIVVPFKETIVVSRCLDPNIMSQNNNALYYTNIDLGKCMFSGSCKRPQNFIEQKQSSYGSNTKRKKSRFIPKIFNQEHLFESLSLRNNSPNKLPQTKWFRGFKLYHRKTGRESTGRDHLIHPIPYACNLSVMQFIRVIDAEP